MAVRFGRNSTVRVDAGDGFARAANPQDPLDLLEWMGLPLEFEEGITLLEIMRCLRPWSDAVSRIAKVDFASWNECANLEQLARREWRGAREVGNITVAPSLIIDRQIDAKAAAIRTRWVSYGVVGNRGGRFTRIPLCRPPWEYAGAKVRLVGKADVRDRMTGGHRPNWNLDPVLRPTADGLVDGFAAVPTVIDTLLKGLFDDLSAADDPDEQAISLAFMFGKLRALSV
jgi:hypothetical protein